MYENITLPVSVSQYWKLINQGSKKRVFLKKTQPSGFLGVLLGFGVLLRFLDKQEKIGKIIQKLSKSLTSFKTIKYCIISGI